MMKKFVVGAATAAVVAAAVLVPALPASAVLMEWDNDISCSAGRIVGSKTTGTGHIEHFHFPLGAPGYSSTSWENGSAYVARYYLKYTATDKIQAYAGGFQGTKNSTYNNVSCWA